MWLSSFMNNDNFVLGLGLVLVLFLAFTTTAIAHHGSDIHDENLISQEYEVVRSLESVERSVESNEKGEDVQALYQDVKINEKDWVQFKDQSLEASNNSASTGRNPQTGKEIKIAASTGGGMGKVTVTSLQILRPAQTSCYSSGQAIHCGVEREDDRTVWCWGRSCEASIQSDEEGKLYCWGESCPAQAIECPSCQEEYEHARSQRDMQQEWNLEENENIELLATAGHEDNIYFALLSDVDVEVGELNLDSKSISSKTISSAEGSDEHESDTQTLSFFNIELESGTTSPNIYADHCRDDRCIAEVASQCPDDSCIVEAAALCSDDSCVAQAAQHCREDRCFEALADHCMDDRCLEAVASARGPPETVTQQGRILDSNDTRAVIDDRDMGQPTSENEITSRVLLPPNIPASNSGRASAALSAGNMTRGISPLDISQEDRNDIRQHLSSIQNFTSADFGLAVAYTASQNERVKSIRYDEERNIVEIEHEDEMKLFGLFPMRTNSKTKVHQDGRIETDRVWWSFLASEGNNIKFKAGADMSKSPNAQGDGNTTIFDEAIAGAFFKIEGPDISVSDSAQGVDPAPPYCDWCTWCPPEYCP